MFDITSFSNAVPFLFILSASVLTNFIGDTMGCKIQKIFSYNPYLKFLVILFLIYTTITLVDKNTSPNEHFIKSLIILLLFILFTKNTLRMTVIIGICMILLFIIEDYKNYYKNNSKNKNELKLVEKLEKTSTFIKYLILILIIVGHIMYISKQHKQFGDDFDIFKLYKGSKCILV